MMPKVDIKKCSNSDIHQIAMLEEKYIPNGWSERSFENFLKNNNIIILKAVFENEIIGFLNGSFVLDEGELLNIAIDESFRRQGIAKNLLENLESYFTEKKVKKIFLEVREKNISAVNFYIKNGFLKNGLRKNYYKNPNDNGILMMKLLSR